MRSDAGSTQHQRSGSLAGDETNTNIGVGRYANKHMPRIDDFSANTKKQLAARAGYVCSCPDCRAPTSGPSLESDAAVNVGEAAHISAAQPNGPRYDATLTSEQRSDIENGIWLCATHATLIDRDETRFTSEVLRDWKIDAENRAFKVLGRPTGCSAGRIVIVSPAVRLGAETAVRVDGKTIPHSTIFDPDREYENPTWFVNGFVLQFSLQKRQERVHAIADHLIVTVHETKEIPPYQSLMMVFPAETNLYYVEIDKNAGTIPREFRPTCFYVAKSGGEIEKRFPAPLVLDDNLPCQIAIRLNAKSSAMYLVSIDLRVSSGEDMETISIMPPQWIIFEAFDFSEPEET